MAPARMDTYRDVVARFRTRLARAVPTRGTVAVVSRGDSDLLKVPERRAWHFPQRADGVYAGYYPADSGAAIQHLEAVRERGAEYLAFPADSLWWLEHYRDFAEHLDERYVLVSRDEEVGAIYGLSSDAAPAKADGKRNGRARAKATGKRNGATKRRKAASLELPSDLDATVLEDLRTIFDPAYYVEQAGERFASADDALAHYLARGHAAGLDPTPLFDGAWYRARYLAGSDEPGAPLLHFLRHAVDDRVSPNPFFDTDYYFAQRPALHERRGNPLVHYVLNARDETAAYPNPLFRDSYYLRTYNDVRGGGALPLAHFLRFGLAEGRYGSHIHNNMFSRLQQSSLKTLTRGNWRRGRVLVFVPSTDREATLDPGFLAERLGADHRLNAVVVALRRGEGDAASGTIVLEDFELASDVFRASALHLLAASLQRLRPLFAVSEVPEVLPALEAAGLPTYVVAPSGRRRKAAPDGAIALPSDRRRHARALVEHAAKDGAVDEPVAHGDGARAKTAVSKVVIPCSDWTVSGVNAALEACGRELMENGWDVEILFTRDRQTVLDSAQGEDHLPDLPYRFLERDRPGIDGMWEALISDVERTAPCILFLAYDFIGNCVVPALSDDVGVVLWVQADDGDYYEQAYRLGRYCNAVVCVSSHIQETIAGLNPAIGEHTRVIHNSSVLAKEIATRRPPRSETLRLVYTGRLVHYQKRILDFVDLARALDRTGVDYEITLIGSFVAHEGSQAPFEGGAREHLENGRIRLAGRLPRAKIFRELDRHAFFVLLSDFEGLPLALVEAMARGCVPVVADSPSGIPELITDGRDGLIVEGRDYDRWAETLVGLWEDEQRLSGMSRAARATVRDAFTVEQAGRQFDELFSGVAGDLRSGRYVRPPALHWGADRSQSGDVLVAPSLFRPTALQSYPGLK